MSGCLCIGGICTSPVCLYISPYIQRTLEQPSVHLSDISVPVSTSICPSVHPLLVSHCRPGIPVDQQHWWSLAVSCMAGVGTCVFWVLFLVSCFLLFGQEAYGCMPRHCRCVLIFLFLCAVFIYISSFSYHCITTILPVTVVCSGTLSLSQLLQWLSP